MRSIPPLLLVCSLFAGGCARSGSPLEEANRAGILHWGNGAEIQDLDGQIVTGIPEHTVLMALMEGLVAPNPVDLGPEPGVAERWDVSADGRTYTFHLRADARWSDGTPVTAEDFLLSYRRMLTPSLGASYANMIYDYVDGAAEYHRGEHADFERVGFRARDARTLEVRLKHPTPYFLNILANHYSWWPVPVKVVERFGGLDRKGTAWTRPENFVGNGPFRLKSWRPDQVLIVEKNPLYWDADRVRLREIHFHPIESQDTEERMFRTGRLHRTNDVPLSKIDVYRRENPELLRIDPFLGVYFYRFNTTRPPFSDSRVRRAFALAIDRESLVRNVTRGGQAPAYHFTPPGVPGYAPRARLEGDLDEARRLLAEAGFPGGAGLPSIDLLYNTHDNHRLIAEAIQQMWRTNLGAGVRLVNQEWKVYLDTTETLAYDLSRAGWIGDYIDPHSFLEIFVTGGGNNHTGWGDPEYDALHARALAAPDDDARFALYERMEEILMRELPVLPIYHYTRVKLLHPSVRGFHPTLLDLHPFKHLHLEVAPDSP